jgi:anaerobic selenocysteine-containing dehydrogenase
MPDQRSICRICHNGCSLLVTVDGGRVTRIAGDPDDPRSRGYSCLKGRRQGLYLESPERLLGSLARGIDGRHRPTASETAVAEIAGRLADIRDRYGPRAIAAYRGTMSYVAAFVAMPFLDALLGAIGTPMSFNPNTIDKGGKDTALSFHGRWMAPAQGFDAPDAVLLIGINPVLTYTGFPAGTPRWYADGRHGGMKSIVIDPRRSDAARLAFLHLQPRPGCDAHILAAMLRVVLEEGAYDRAFVEANVQGLAALQRAVAPFRAEAVAAFADVAADDIVLAARTYAGAVRGYAMAGTGPSMSGPSTLVEYLVLCLETLCGRWLRGGDRVTSSPTLAPAPRYVAQAAPPRADWAFGEPIRVRGLSQTEAGLPTAALADEILTPGPGQVRALICFGGNPAVAFPDSAKTGRALRDLELLVQIDPWMSETARHAHYIIVPPMPLETPSSSVMQDVIAAMGKTGYGGGSGYATYAPAAVTPPAGADLIEEWRFFHDVHCAMGFDPEVRHPFSADAPPIRPQAGTTTDEVLAWMSAGSRIAFDRVRAAGRGALYPDPPVVVEPKAEGWTGRLDIGSAEMMRLVGEAADQLGAAVVHDAAFPFKLVCRREANAYNSSCNVPGPDRPRAYNPAHLHPDDLAGLGAEAGDLLEIRSELAAIPAVAAADDTLRRGLVSMMFGFGAGGAESDARVREIGSNPNRLIADDQVFDRYTGQPRMSNVPVAVRRLAAAPPTA